MEQQMYKVQIDGEERSFPAGTTYLQIAGEYQERYPHDIVLVYVNGKLQELGKKLKKDCTLHFVTTGETIGNLTYRRGVSFLLVKAVYDTIGHDKIEQVRIHFSVDKGYYCTIKGDQKLDQELLARIEERMHEMQVMRTHGLPPDHVGGGDPFHEVPGQEVAHAEHERRELPVVEREPHAAVHVLPRRRAQGVHQRVQLEERVVVHLHHVVVRPAAAAGAGAGAEHGGQAREVRVRLPLLRVLGAVEDQHVAVGARLERNEHAVLGRHRARAEHEADVDARGGAQRGRLLLQRVRHADEVAPGVLAGHGVHADEDAHKLRRALATDDTVDVAHGHRCWRSADDTSGGADAGARGHCRGGKRVAEVGGQRKEKGEA